MTFDLTCLIKIHYIVKKKKFHVINHLQKCLFCYLTAKKICLAITC